MSSHLAIRDLSMIPVFQSFKCSLALRIITTCFLMDSNSSTSFTIHICFWTRHDLDGETPASLGIIQILCMEHRTNWLAKWHQPYLFMLSGGLGEVLRLWPIIDFGPDWLHSFDEAASARSTVSVLCWSWSNSWDLNLKDSRPQQKRWGRYLDV